MRLIAVGIDYAYFLWFQVKVMMPIKDSSVTTFTFGTRAQLGTARLGPLLLLVVETLTRENMTTRPMRHVVINYVLL